MHVLTTAPSMSSPRRHDCWAPPRYGEPLNISALMAPLVMQYISYLTMKFDDELEIAWCRETWAVGMDGGAGYAPIVWDLMKLFSSTLEARP